MGLVVALVLCAVFWKILSVLFAGLALVAGVLAGICLAFVLGILVVALFIKPADPTHRSSRRGE